MGRQAATVDEVIFDFLRHEADGPAQLNKGESLLAKIEHSFETNVEMLGNLLGSP
jgi:hypothetical protein